MFKAGFSRVDVTPPLATELTGYFRVRVSDGVLDPIYLNAVAIGDGENTALIITADFMYITERTMTGYRELIEKSTGLSKENILIQSVHQHTSTTPGADGPTDAAYDDLLSRKFCDVAKMALDDMSDATLSYAEKETAEPISFVRRFKMKDGSIKTNPGAQNPDIDCPIGDADNTVRFVKMTRKGKKDIALVGFQTHPDVISGLKFSADWPGFVRTFTEKRLDNVHCILVNGCQGDVNHLDVTKPWDREANARYAHSQFMGNAITDVVVNLWDKTTPVKDGSVFCKISMELVMSNNKGAERMAESIEFMNNYYAGIKGTMQQVGEARRIIAMTDTPIVSKIPVTAIRFGDVALVGYGGEPFTEYATVVRDAFPDLHVLSVCNANGSQGYLVSAKAFAEGGYEALSSDFLPELASILQGSAISMLKSFK